VASSAPNGIRTRAAALKGRCPRPLDDGGSTIAAFARGACRRGPPQHRGRKPVPAKRPSDRRRKADLGSLFPAHGSATPGRKARFPPLLLPDGVPAPQVTSQSG
jgi:hypothetical protein